MIGWFLLMLSAGNTFAGVHVQMPYLQPAGVTYSAVSQFPGQHLQYSTSSVAYGNGGLVRSSLPHLGIPYSSPIVAAGVAQPVVSTLHSVPAVAQVPITKYEAQPALIQNLVDVAKAKVASSKIEVRRPAIQKEFYDVEERLVIRPVGSAVVELDEPVSKSQKGPTVVQPAVHAVPTVRTLPVVSSRSFHSHLLSASYPSSVSIHGYPLQGPIAAHPVHYHPSFNHEIAHPEEIPQQEQQQVQPSLQEQEQYPQNQEDIPQQVTEEEQQEQQQPQFQQDQQIQQQDQQQEQQIQQQEPEFDDSDSIAIDNPEVARARPVEPEPQTDISQFQRSNPQSPAQTQLFVSQPTFSPQFLRRDIGSRQGVIATTQLQAQEEIVARLQAQTDVQLAQLQRSQQLLQLQQQELARSRMAANSLVRSQAISSEQNGQQMDTFMKSDAGNADLGVQSRISSSFFKNSLIDDFINVTRSTSSDVIPSVRISQEQSLSNQDRLIALLTSRGGVVETRSNGEPDSHQIRARVLSVTPAPEGSSAREEKINTRRIVVNRPIQTVEEVDVVRPFTKIERVAVHSPGVIKTARFGVAHVPTSLPVHGYSHALPVSAIPAY